MGQSSSSDAIRLQDLEGQWHVLMTDFPMWLKGDKRHPKFNYSIVEKCGRTVLLDRVTYVKKGKEKDIVGYDKPLSPANRKFVWRGKGLLFVAKSKWELVHLSAEMDWALIHFEKTLFTPEGWDVIASSAELDLAARAQVAEALQARGLKLVALD